MAEEVLTVAALAVLAMAAAGFAAHRLRFPPALGYLAAGMAFPAALAYLAGADALSSATIGEVLAPDGMVGILAELGVLVLLFLIGLELDLTRLRESIRSTALVTPFGIGVPAILVASVTLLMGWSLLQAVALGLALALGSDLFGERLTSSPDVSNAARRRALGALISEDVAAVGLLALLVGLAVGGGFGAGEINVMAWELGQLLFFLVLLTALALLVVPRVLDEAARGHVQELVTLWALGMIVLFGLLGWLAGSAELGALVAGVAAAEAGSRYVARNALGGVRDVALGVFFFASGLLVDPAALWAHIGLVAAVASVVLVGKLLVHVPAAAFSGMALRPSLQTGFGLVAVGEFSLILVTVAEREGLAHPLARTAVVGAMVILLVTSSLLMRGAGRVESLFWRLPKRMRGPLQWLAEGVRRGRGRGASDPSQRRSALQRLGANALLVAAWALLATWAYRRLEGEFAGNVPFAYQILAFGIAIAVALPLVLGAYKGYRQLVWSLVGLRPGERVGAGRVRSRLVDAWVGLSAVLALVPLVLVMPETLPVLLGALLVAGLVATLAWRGLTRFHRALEDTVTRVLGRDEEAGALLDRVLQEYPWGVRFAAVSVPPGSAVAGRTVRESRIAELTGAIVAVVQRRQEEIVNPRPDHRILTGDTLVLLGDVHQLSRAEALLVASGEALRMTVQSRSAQVEEVEVAEGSDWVGATLEKTRIRDRTGTLVVGVWRRNAQHPVPFHPGLELHAGDRLILVGTPLQMQRAQDIAAGRAGDEEARRPPGPAADADP